ncbi:MAG TPA: nuclear transport factor 2 family protein [Saprospiraceae bacterium]|nr:nuclear transport factor 2 family protein [Saprospiraceae bacterium]
MRIIFVSSIFALLLTGCQSGIQKDSAAAIEQAKQEILQAEKDFAEMADAAGVQAAFLAFAAENAVLNRDNDLYQGLDAIQRYFEQSPLRNVSLQWQADFVDAAASGDMGYTYGRYVFVAEDPAGKPIRTAGIFHTVWKKQPDGKWKFVYD